MFNWTWRSPADQPYDPATQARLRAQRDGLQFQAKLAGLLPVLDGLAGDVKSLKRDIAEVKYARDVAASVRRGQAHGDDIDVKAFERAVIEMRADYEARLATKSMGQWRAPYANLKIVSLE